MGDLSRLSGWASPFALLVVASCAPSDPTPRAQETERNQGANRSIEWQGPGKNPCLAKNPIDVISPVTVPGYRDRQVHKASRTHRQATVAFSLPSAASVCLVVELKHCKNNPRVEVEIDDRYELRLPQPKKAHALRGGDHDSDRYHGDDDDDDDDDDSQRGDDDDDGDGDGEHDDDDDDGNGRHCSSRVTTSSVPLRLGIGAHQLEIDDVKNASSVTIRLLAAGPTVDAFSPIVAATGAEVTLVGEGFSGVTLVEIAGRPYPVVSSAPTAVRASC